MLSDNANTFVSYWIPFTQHKQTTSSRTILCSWQLLVDLLRSDNMPKVPPCKWTAFFRVGYPGIPFILPWCERTEHEISELKVEMWSNLCRAEFKKKSEGLYKTDSEGCIINVIHSGFVMFFCLTIFVYTCVGHFVMWYIFIKMI